MARGPSSTIVQPVGSQTAARTSTRSGLPVRQVTFTADEVADPKKLAQLLTQLNHNLYKSLQTLGTNITLQGNIVQGLVFSGGQTLFVAHGLGRAYQGAYAVRAQGNPPLFVEAALPKGATPAQLIGLTSTNAGTYDILVF